MRWALSPSQLSWHWPHKGIPLAQGIAASSPKENHNPGYWPFQAHNFFGQLPLPCSIWCHLHPPTACSLAASHDPQCQPWPSMSAMTPIFKKKSRFVLLCTVAENSINPISGHWGQGGCLLPNYPSRCHASLLMVSLSLLHVECMCIYVLHL